jgi:hypothetical protein
MKTQEAVNFFKSKRKVKKMKTQKIKIKKQKIQSLKKTKKGENTMKDQLENPVKIKEIVDDRPIEETIATPSTLEEAAEVLDIIEEADDPTTETQLPQNVVEPPRNAEEMHLKHLRQWPNAVNVYLKVSDDEGEVLGNKVLERKVKAFCDQYADLNTEIKDPSKVIEEAKELAIKYTLQINMVESGLTGTITKYRIRQGMVFNIMKKLVKATEGSNWIVWFKKNFDAREFRSTQDYMRLAKTPNIIRYAVFGKERLLQILRQLSESDRKTEDPIGTFIEKNSINFNPSEEIDAQELKIETDIAINHQKCIDAGITEITKDMVEVLVRNGREIEAAHIQDLKAARVVGQNIVERFKQIVASDGRFKPIMTPDRKAEGFKKTTSQFLKAIESAISDEEYRSQVDAAIIASLKEKLLQLENLVQPTT